jgi:hypothetical protein
MLEGDVKMVKETTMGEALDAQQAAGIYPPFQPESFSGTLISRLMTVTNQNFIFSLMHYGEVVGGTSIFLRLRRAGNERAAITITIVVFHADMMPGRPLDAYYSINSRQHNFFSQYFILHLRNLRENAEIEEIGEIIELIDSD